MVISQAIAGVRQTSKKSRSPLASWYSNLFEKCPMSVLCNQCVYLSSISLLCIFVMTASSLSHS